MSWDQTMVPNYGSPSLHFEHGKGARLTASDGNEYVDLAGGVAVNVLGQAHPAVVKAVQGQVERLGHVSNLYQHGPVLELADRLRRLTDMRCLFVNSGAEANEAALKLTRLARDGVVLAFDGSFHGRTMGALALTGQPAYHEGFGPLPQGIVHVPWNDPARLEEAFEEHDVAAVFFEPIQGEGGVHPMSQETANTLQRLCDEHDALLVADEVQVGIGRTGAWFAHTALGLHPHIITVAKALGGGMPIGACLVRDELANLMGPGTHGCTFGGHPVCAAAANATLDAIESEDLIPRARRLGQRARDRLRRAGIEARGAGLLLGVSVSDAHTVRNRMEHEGFLVTVAGPTTVRMAPPLIITEQDWDAGIDALIHAVQDQP